MIKKLRRVPGSVSGYNTASNHVVHAAQVDWFMNHANSRPDALHAGRMGVKYGGTQPTPHASFIDPNYAHLILG